ncbi:hypothetical protein KZZ52_56735 [Dactylosporangium sp. AC04546]|uniref:hypothetical protein n=1 Tax=Dactylosporangium sp. AC04546 TaxID=2862460 RepID=UPI001EDE951F|nr:hypothetical protein [Dactylosporangium sp. AC04546]WVK83260.1 hypothetical protein KZZ52_56735 [Dactylosporangium sp. AC04546]
MSDTSGSNGSTPSDDALEAIVTAWREPVNGAIAGRAVVSGGVNGAAGPRGRAEVRSQFSDTLAPMSPPVSAPPPVQPSTSTLHYGHYGPDGQGWPTSTHTGEPTQTLQAAPGTVYGVQPPAEPQRPVSPAPYEQPYEQPQQHPHQQPQQHPHQQAYEQAYEQPHQHQQAYEQQHQQAYEQPHQQAYEQQHQQAYEQPHQPHYQQPYQQQAYQPQAYEQQARDDWAAYQEQQYQEQQPPQLQPQWGPPQQQPQQPEEFDWAAAPSQPLPAQRAPADDPLGGPLPSELLGSGTQMAAEPAMPSLADALSTPAYDPPELPQRVPSQPDVPQVPETEPMMSEAGAPDLARIATYLREDEDEEPSPDGRPDGFDIPAVLRAVQGVSGVREATLRKNPDGVHTLRLELLDEADPGQVSRAVARLLNERMGLAAEPNLPGMFAPVPPPPAPPRPPVRNNAPHSALPGYGREARRRRPVSGVRRGSAEVVPAEHAQPVPVGPPTSSAISSARVVIDSVDVNTQGIDAMVEVRLIADGQPAVGVASGPNVDGYMLRLAAAAAGSAVDQLLVDADGTARGRCYIEHAAVVPMGGCEVAVVVLLLMYDGAVEQLTGSSVVTGDPRQAVVRGTLAAVNRRLEALLP